MKFCYMDESATQDNSAVVAVGFVADANRMHLTKADWLGTLLRAEEHLGTALPEFKAKDLYRGSGRWNQVPGEDRARVISDLVDWLTERKHSVVYAGVLTSQFYGSTRPERMDIPDPWCAADRHLILALQRHHQSLPSPKGNTVVVLDQGGHEDHLSSFVLRPESWTDHYYGRPKKSRPLSQIVDVPYFVPSHQALLVQAADLYALILRRYVELSELGHPERYATERDTITGWARQLASRAPLSDMYPTKNRTAAHTLFHELAPPSTVALKPS